jgi:hypothetical protein
VLASLLRRAAELRRSDAEIGLHHAGIAFGDACRLRRPATPLSSHLR